MAFKIPNIPGSKSYEEEIADYWELEALKNPQRYIAKLEMSRVLSTESDEIDHDGIVSEDDVIDAYLDDIFNEIQRRKIACGQNRYPFDFKRFSIKLHDQDSLPKLIYVYLLLTTRFNMTEQKYINGVDGTLIFEELSSIIGKNFFGHPAESFVFGTAQAGSFEGKVHDLIDHIGEGGRFTNPNKNDPSKQDDALDIVVWKNFSDNNAGKLIGFGQCKTGTSWRSSYQYLDPDKFCHTWFSDFPVISPIPLVFITDTLYKNFNFISDQQGYLFLNRFRIMEFLPSELEEDLTDQIQDWVAGALDELRS